MGGSWISGVIVNIVLNVHRNRRLIKDGRGRGGGGGGAWRDVYIPIATLSPPELFLH